MWWKPFAGLWSEESLHRRGPEQIHLGQAPTRSACREQAPFRIARLARRIRTQALDPAPLALVSAMVVLTVTASR
jgi:hypothetical protein